MTHDQDRVTVRLKRGAWEIEITSRKEELAESIERVVSGIKDSGEQSSGGPASIPKTIRETLASLTREGWFNVPRRLAEVVGETASRGNNYGQSQVSHALLDLVKERVLAREGTDKRYTYVKATAARGISARSSAR
jgi:hypothetical protein